MQRGLVVGGHLSINRLVLLAALPPVVALAFIALLTARFASSERDAEALVRHTYQVIGVQQRLHDDIQTAETGMRGFLLSHDPSFRSSYEAAVRRIPQDLRAFRELTADNPLQQSRAGRLQEMLAARLRGLELGFISSSEPAVRAPQAVQGLARGRQQMAGIRGEIESGLAEERALLDQRDRDRRESESLMTLSAAGAALVTVAILMLAAVLLVRNNASLAAAERERASEAAILRTTLEAVRDGVAYFTAEGQLRACNHLFFVFLGLPENLSAPGNSLAALAATARDWPFPVLAPPEKNESGQISRHLSWRGRELEIYKAQVPTGGFLIGVVDSSARMRAEAIVRQAQKMEAIGHLTGGVAHDFNNLLQIISANLDLASGGAGEASPAVRRRLQNAIGAVSRGARLTTQLLAFARRQALDPRSIDPGRIIRNMTDLLRRTLGEQIEVETVIGGGLWNTLADPTQVENTILNLAINARDAMPEGGKLTLEVANAHLDDAYAALNNEVTPGQYVMLAVSDTGTGMRPEILARVFEPFFTTKPEGKGTGLGLAQAYGFAKQSGGHIKIYSEHGHGTTVKLYLPRTRRETDRTEEAGGLPVQGGNERILVVEDDEGVRAAAIDMLTELGYQVSKAGDAESALAMLDEARPDLIFTDVVMPGPLPVREFTRRAQQRFPGVRILYTSGYTQNAIVHNGKLDEDAFLISKPYRKDELARKLRAVLAAGAMPAPPAPAPAAPLGKVLVVEDVALIRMTTVDMVEQIGFATAEAADGAEALAILENDPAITVLLTDLGLPGMSGRQLVGEVRRQRPALKIIVASGYSTEADDFGDDGIVRLTKPYDLAQLTRALA
jgi:signal transduction histidine kinase/CheY-like chemotaxis protein